ncbi:hypothetical protein ACQKP6_04160, partial [Pseudomonas fluorescens]|uniref:hypothetical protein n=1 Tax=Pseudomonas fluorescens TaxID=294 RepID=UPI003D0743AD
GSWLACDGGLTADQSLADARQSIVGASLLAMATWQPAYLLRMYTNKNCGSWLACDGGLTADQSLADARQSIVGASLLAMAA